MAKVSKKELTDIGQDWGNDGTGLPYSGQEVQKFIKSELNKRPDNEASKVIVTDELQAQLFGNGTRKVITAIEGTSEALTVTSLDSSGAETSETINIGSPDANDRIVTITSQLTNSYINVGGQTSLLFGYSVADYQGDIIENQLASASLSLTRQESAQPFYTTDLGSIGSTTDIGLTNQVFDLTNILSENVVSSAKINITLSVQYTYSYVDDEGKTVNKTIRKSRTALIEVISLSLTVPFNIGSFNNSGQVSIPYTVRGNGSKSVYLYKNGELADSVTEITNNSYSGVFVVNIDSTVNYQVVAEAIAGSTTVRSASYYFDIIGQIAGSTIALKYEDSTGTIQSVDLYQNPTISFPKFNNFKLDYFVVNPSVAQVDLSIITQELDSNNSVVIEQESKQVVNREIYTYSKRIKSPNRLSVKLVVGTTQRTINVSPMESHIVLDVPTESLLLNLDADGRSNSEANPGNWSYGDITTDFSRVNWQSNGWLEDNGTALVLKNGAKAVINYPLFQYNEGSPVTNTGCTFEILFKCSNPTLEPHDIITCNWLGSQDRITGLKITTNYVGVNTGTVTEYRDEDGNVTQTVEDAVGSQYAVDTYYKYAFIIDPSLGINGLCLGYLDGVLSFVSDIPRVFANNNNVPITIDSSYADVYVKSIKYYGKALTSDECVNDYIIDQNDLDTIETLYDKNSVLGVDSFGRTYVSPSKIRAMGKGVMIISPSKSQTGEVVNIQDLNKSSDKKSYYGPFRVDYFAPASDLNLGYQTTPTKGDAFNFTHTECAIRVQGTTSTKRPRKNFRLHYNKRDKDNKPTKGSFIVGGEARDTFKYAMSQNSAAVPIACLKVDYVDSSMTHNTGGALIYNELVKAVPSMWNAAQQREYDGLNPNSIKTRVAIEGFPIDVFAATDVVNPDYTNILDDTNYKGLVYMGQYNYNNDKSKSGNVFGFDGSYTYNDSGEYDKEGAYQPVCLEFLDNTAPLNSFQVKFSGNEINDEATFSGFSNALEVRAPEDVTDFVADYGLDELATAPDLKDGDPSAGKPHTTNTYQYIPSQIKRVFKFIGECAAEVAQNNGVSPSALNNYTSAQFEALNWTSSKFSTEAINYFNVSNICGWYIWTDYTIAVDQRAKNMMLYTMDGLHWLLQYYDGDTMMGERNDTFLAYDYLTDRDTWDYAVGQYAFQGHDSWLWYLIRANFGELLDSTCQDMRSSGRFSPSYFKQVFNQQIVNSWSQRQYNYSQEYKYIDPLTETGYPTDIGTNYINAAQGSRQAHRDYLIDNRFALLDSKYRAGDYEKDNFAYYGVDGMAGNAITIVSSIPFYFAWKTPNTPIRERQFANPTNDYTIQLNVVGNTTNNPASILGASKIKELYIGRDGTASWSVDQSKALTLPNLQKLVAAGLGANGSGPLYLPNCTSLTHLDLHGSNFSGLYRMENNAKMEYLDLSDTGITNAKLADGCPLKTMKLNSPALLYLSNYEELKYNGTSDDTLTIQSWDNFEQLVVNNCPNISWQKLLTKLQESSSTTKWLRITGINRIDSITWLDQFISRDGITWAGLDANGNEVRDVQLTGDLYLPVYEDEAKVAEYQAKFPSLIIHQPEYTLIEGDESIIDETEVGTGPNKGNYTNLDNSTGSRFNNTFIPSGHISKILNNTHRYLGKVVKKGNVVEVDGNIHDTNPAGRYLELRDREGEMLLIQLADEDSRYYNTDYSNTSTRKEASLDGTIGHGEAYTVVPGFWYKGINMNVPFGDTPSLKFTAFSYQSEKPSRSNQIREIKMSDLGQQTVNDLTSMDEGLCYYQRLITKNGNTGTIENRIPTSVSNYSVYRVRVEGYKKLMYPCDVATNTCCLFTDDAGTILTNSGGSVVNIGEIPSCSPLHVHEGMPSMITIPEGAKWFYFPLAWYRSNDITNVNCDIVMHRGDNYTSGDAMTRENAKDWIADMEPDWQYMEPTPIACAEAASDDKQTLYTSFNGSKESAKGTNNYTQSDYSDTGVWTQYTMQRAAFKRGLQLIDYEATKMIAMMFVAKYGRRNSQNVLGMGSNTTARKLGVTAQYGITDTVCTSSQQQSAYIPVYSPTGGVVSNIKVDSPCFLGIENVQGNTYEYLSRTYYMNDNSTNCGKTRVIMPDLSERYIPFYNPRPNNNYPKMLMHGKYCDITSCAKSENAGGPVVGYCDWQEYPGTAARTTLLSSCRVGRSALSADAGGGVFCLYSNSYASVGASYSSYGSRLQFRGKLRYTTDIEEFENTSELRYE